MDILFYAENITERYQDVTALGVKMGKYKNYDITVIVTQRCNARCVMCNSHENPTDPIKEINIETLKKIPMCKFIQITGGEPFVRNDLRDVVAVLRQRTKRLMINTNGYYTEKIMEIGKEFPDVVIRVSIDGERETHNKIRGIDIYDRAMKTLSGLKEIGVKDVGISFTLQDSNYMDLLKVYHHAVALKIDFGCSIVHNSFYFSKDDNEINSDNMIENQLRLLIGEQLQSKRKKDWARAFVNDFNIKYMKKESLPIKCDAGVSSFFIDAYANILPCNMTVKPLIMGNLKEKEWDEILAGEESQRIISFCKNCKINCWSICNVQSEIKKKLWIPAWWLVRNKIIKINI